MILSEETKNKITEILDSKEFMSDLYEGLDDKKREALGQFYTGSKICIQMIEKYDCETLSGKTILDPTCGSGNLLIACLIAGADSDKLFGNEYDAVAVELCRKRLVRAAQILSVPQIKYWQVHQGNALQKMCLTQFNEEYIAGDSTGNHYDPKYIDDLEYAQNGNSWNIENEQAKRRALSKEKKPQISLWDLS